MNAISGAVALDLASMKPGLTISEAAEHPQLKARGMVIEVNRGDGTKQAQIGLVIKFGSAYLKLVSLWRLYRVRAGTVE